MKTRNKLGVNITKVVKVFRGLKEVEGENQRTRPMMITDTECRLLDSMNHLIFSNVLRFGLGEKPVFQVVPFFLT